MKVELNTKFEMDQTVYWYVGYDIRKGKVSSVIIDGSRDSNDYQRAVWSTRYRIEYFNGMTCHDTIPENCLYGSLQEAGDIK